MDEAMLKSVARLFRKKQPAPPVDRRTELRDRYPDFSEAVLDVILQVEPFTMTSPERVQSLCASVDYLVNQDIAGDIVECGVWRGGSMMAIANLLKSSGDTGRQLHLYDTFEGMPAAGEADKDFLNVDANRQLAEQDIADPCSVWCYSGLEEVQTNMQSTGYPDDCIRYVKGRVEDTLTDDLPTQIALLRLDTDWYESTRVCLEQLYPLLVEGGVLIIDDYGHWQGCRKAVDEYFRLHSIPILLQRIDYTGRIAIKPGTPQVRSQKLSASA